MTTKKALENVKEWIKFIEEEKYATEYQRTNPHGLRAILSKIQEDLEILEILKKRPNLLWCFTHDSVLTWDVYNDTYSDAYKQYIGATKEDFEKVKEWLENDKQM